MSTTEPVVMTYAEPADLALVIDTHWEERYTERTEHPLQRK